MSVEEAHEQAQEAVAFPLSSPSPSPRPQSAPSRPQLYLRPQPHPEPEPPSPAEQLKAAIPALHAEIDSLTKALSDISTHEADVAEQVRSLKYALQLTRGEVQRRQRSNTELNVVFHTPSSPVRRNSSADSSASGPPSATNEGPASSDELHKEVQRLEGELLNAKRDAANVVYEVETLSQQLARLQATSTEVSGPSVPTTTATSAPTTPAATTSSPLTGAALTGGAGSSSRSSPTSRGTRLIGDVDGVIAFADVGSDGAEGNVAAGRLGLSASGRLGIYSYASAEMVVGLDAQDVRLDESPLSERDAEIVSQWLSGRRVVINGEEFLLAGLSESVRAAGQLILDNVEEEEDVEQDAAWGKDVEQDAEAVQGGG